MTMGELKRFLLEIKDAQDAGCTDKEEDHMKADGALLKLINDPEVSMIYNSINKWYS